MLQELDVSARAGAPSERGERGERPDSGLVGWSADDEAVR